MPIPKPSARRAAARTLLTGALALGAIGCAVSQPGSTPFRPGDAATRVVAVPPTIDLTGTRDVTAPLNTFLASVPNGSTVVFPTNGRYRVEGTLLLDGRHDLVIEGHRSTFFATTEGVRNRMHWSVKASSRVTLRALTVIGANEDSGVNGTFDVNREAQHAFSVQGSDHVTLDNVEAHDVYGDFVYIDKHRGVPATFVTVQNSLFSGSGRQGIAISSGEDILIKSNSISDVRRSMFDLEPYSENLTIRRVRIVNNDIGPARFHFLASGGAAAVIEDIEVRGNRVTGMLPNVVVRGHAEQPRRRITIVDNVTDGTTNRPVFSLHWVDGATITGNRVPFSILKPEDVPYAVETRSSCGVVIGTNDFGGARILDTDHYRCSPTAAPSATATTTTTQPPTTTTTTTQPPTTTTLPPAAPIPSEPPGK